VRGTQSLHATDGRENATTPRRRIAPRHPFIVYDIEQQLHDMRTAANNPRIICWRHGHLIHGWHYLGIKGYQPRLVLFHECQRLYMPYCAGMQQEQTTDALSTVQ